MIRAWQRLDSCRQIVPMMLPIEGGRTLVTTIEGPIPWTAIRAWGEHEGLGTAAIERLAEVITILDRDRARQQAADLQTRT